MLTDLYRFMDVWTYHGLLKWGRDAPGGSVSQDSCELIFFNSF